MIRLYIAVLFLFSTALAAPTQLQKINLLENDANSQLQLDFNNKFQPTLMNLDAPPRLVINLKNIPLKITLPKVTANNLLIKNIRPSKSKDKTDLIVLDLKQKADYQTSLTKLPNNSYRYTLTLSHKSAASLQPATVTVTTPAAPSSAKAGKPVLTANTAKLQDLVVVIDPGHGGKDPGARGRKGTLEKNVVLAIAKYLKQELQKVPGIKVYLTREHDVFIPLRQRLSVARKHKADIFIALHADAFINASASGASVFALSQRGATSESARWLAEKENQSELLGGADLSDKDPLLRSVLIDMSQTATINNSLNLGYYILQQLRGFTKLHAQRVEQAAFVVLKSPDIPSLLIENGFISNPKEEQNLRSPAYQQKLAREIKTGIVAYFKEYLPQNTVFAQQYNKN